jgi:hypothetical protein
VQRLSLKFLMMSFIATSAIGSPITYNIAFTAVGILPTAGSFTYDSAAPLNSRFTNFTVTWDSRLFNLTSVANTGESFVGTDCGTTPSSQSVFSFLSGINVCVNPSHTYWSADGNVGSFGFADQENSGFGPPAAGIVASAAPDVSAGVAGGTFSIAPAATAPEPSTWLLLSCGFLVVGRLRRDARVRRGDCRPPNVLDSDPLDSLGG